MLINEDERRIYRSTTKRQRIIFIMHVRYESFHECHIDFNISSSLNIICVVHFTDIFLNLSLEYLLKCFIKILNLLIYNVMDLLEIIRLNLYIWITCDSLSFKISHIKDKKTTHGKHRTKVVVNFLTPQWLLHVIL